MISNPEALKKFCKWMHSNYNIIPINMILSKYRNKLGSFQYVEDCINKYIRSYNGFAATQDKISLYDSHEIALNFVRNDINDIRF
jgi:hypothetical protein